MGEAKRKKDSGEIDFWFHGTDEHFLEWGHPPIASRYKPELYPHCFISLSKDLELAKGAGKLSGGLCRAKLVESARIIDLRIASDDAEMIWKKVKESEFGHSHAMIQTFNSWLMACNSGEVLRTHTTDQILGFRLSRLSIISNDPAYPLAERNKAHLVVQNFTRKWIDTVIFPAKELGYQAVICAEIDRHRVGSRKSCLNLHVFDPNSLTRPDWISIPNEIKMQNYVEYLNAMGIEQ